MNDDPWEIALEKLRYVLSQWHEARRLDIPRGPDQLRSYLFVLREKELQARNQIDQFCRDWIERKRIQMRQLSRKDPDYAALLYDRFAEPESYCARCHQRPPFRALNVKAVLDHVLIEHWAMGGGADDWRRRIDD